MPVGEDAEGGEEVGPTLHLVEDDQPPEVSQGQLGVVQEREVGGALEVEHGAPAAEPARDLAGEGRLADLAGPEERDHREAPKAAFQGGKVLRTRDPHEP
jgi:hypothetical protein